MNDDEKLDKEFVDSVQHRPLLKVPLEADGPYCVYCARYGKDCEYARPGKSSVAHLCIYYVKGSHKEVSPDDAPSPEYMAEATRSQGVAPMLAPVMHRLDMLNVQLEKVCSLLRGKTEVTCPPETTRGYASDGDAPEKSDLHQNLINTRKQLRRELEEAKIEVEWIQGRLGLVDQLLFECDPEAKYDDDVQS